MGYIFYSFQLSDMKENAKSVEENDSNAKCQTVGIIGTRSELLAVMRLQAWAKGRLTRLRLEKTVCLVEDTAECNPQLAQQHPLPLQPSTDAGPSSTDDVLEDVPFVVRNLDTGEYVELPISNDQALPLHLIVAPQLLGCL